MSKKWKTILYAALLIAAFAIISIWVDWNTTQRAEFNSLVRQADGFYEKGDFEAAGAIYKELLSMHPKKRQLSVGEGALIIFLAGAAAFLAYLYADKSRSLRNILSKSAEVQAIPEVLNFDYDFDRAKVRDDADLKLLGNLRELFEAREIYLDKNLSIDSLARMAGVTKARLSHFINEVFGCNFPTFMNNYRVTKAVALFSDPVNDIYTVEAIGENCGFNNRQAFHSVFKKRIGMPPSKFRELIKKSGS